ncbi:D-tagatose-bisphosphate aldolase, class II, non-catalytic subunit [Caballeronia sp. 15711]|uniref:D-tagatose-bisphosphate aldolase, class II, non-catalytic subunit n=1 Tax=Caballeronia sp. 15711 TaxID=3391029 RepID=UPI0039E41D11
MNSIVSRLSNAHPASAWLAGIYSICSAHPWVLEAAMRQALEDETPLLIESTSNQVDQYGGYTGMKPADFVDFVRGIAERVGFSHEHLILGGDHLGPNAWRHLPAEEAMQRAEALIDAYASAGFTKLHLDTSMSCADDPERLSDAVVASRAARLCAVAEAAVKRAGLSVSPVYVIGTEVPVPGGAAEELEVVEPTSREAAIETALVHKKAWQEQGIQDAWSRVVALVVQPGVEFDHTKVIDYVPSRAESLKSALDDLPGMVFEAHSTDYQTPEALAVLVRDGFRILKVGPGVTFALREALYALADIETQLVSESQRSNLRAVVERVMLSKPSNWEKYYHGDAEQQRVLRTYSYSDRVRYYWADQEINAAAEKLLDNLSALKIPENLLSQSLSEQYWAVRRGLLKNEPLALVQDRVRQVIRTYAAACRA